MEKKTKKKVILINSSLLIFMIIGVVFAWFASNFDNSLDANEVSVVADNALELSVNPAVDGWSTSIQLSDKTWFKNIKFTDITGSGDGNFLRPVLTQDVEYAYVSDTWASDPVGSDVADNEKKADYAKFTLNLRSKDPLYVYLGADSSVQPQAGMDNLKGDTTLNKSSFSTSDAPFSRDVVVGAVRISANSSADRLFTWIPRPDVYCSTASTIRSVTANDIVVNSTCEDSLKHTYYAYSTKTLSSLTGTAQKVVTGTIDNTSKQLLATLNGTKNADGYYTGSVDFCIWIEGCDNEARRAFVDGKFKVNLNITSEDI